MIVFTKGFRASDLKKKANLKGVSNIDIAIIEEAEDIRDVEKFNTFVDSLRKEGCLVIIILNTPDIGHWILERYFNTIPVPDEDGFFEIVPKQIAGFLCIKTSFEDNKYLPANVVQRYKDYGNPESTSYNKFYYNTAIKGYASSGRKGQVFTKVQPISLKAYLALPFKEFYGQDFGTASPAGTIGGKFDKNNYYARELNYLPLATIEIAKLYCRLKLGMNDEVIADNADEKAWRRLKGGWQRNELSESDFKLYPDLARGFFVKPCVKGADSVTGGIDLLNEMNLFVVEESLNFWKELRSYCYAKDKNENYTNDPIDDFNHCIDPWRYLAQAKRGRKAFQAQESPR